MIVQLLGVTISITEFSVQQAVILSKDKYQEQ